METKANVLITGPSIEPVSLTEIKEHLRVDSNDIENDVTITQTIAPADHAVAAAYTLVGTGVDVLNSNTLASVVAGTCGVGASFIVKLQESDDDITYTDVYTFATIDETTDNQNYEYEYIGERQYIRAVVTVAVDSCNFGVNIVEQSNYACDDTLLSSYITSSRRWCELYQNRVYITQTWDAYLDCFPSDNKIQIDNSPLQSVTSVKYYETDETENTFSSDYYHVDIAENPGNVVLGYSQTWPQETLRTVNGVIVRYIAGYGDNASDVPEYIRLAIKLLVGHYYENREATMTGSTNREIPLGIKSLLDMDSRNFL